MRDFVVVEMPRRSKSKSLSLEARGMTHVELRISEAKLSEAEAKSLSQDKAKSVVPRMPLKLIKPLRISTSTSPPSAKLAWGLEIIGVGENYQGDGIVAAVLDTGIDGDHEAFEHLGNRLKVQDFTGEGAKDKDGHGTHCAGTVFGLKSNDTRIGIAPNVAAALVGKVIGDKGASTTSLLNGLNWALSNGAHVISLSLGMDFPGYAEELVKEGYPASIATSMALTAYRQNMQLFDAFGDMLSRHENAAQGSVIIAAAGNESRCDEDPDFIVNVSPPAAADKFLSVGAVGRTDKGLHVADFSNRGPSLVGPGVDIVSAALGGSLAVMSGTSMACPHVAGAAVLWAQYLNESKKRITHDALRRRILESVIELPGFSESEVGAGLVSVPR